MTSPAIAARLGLAAAYLQTALCLGGCGSSAAAADGGSGTTDGGGTGVVPPDIAWLEQGAPPLTIAPCPAGWTEVDDGTGVTTCDPFPEGGALDCPAGQAHFPGEPGCAAVGAPCPAGDFAEGLPTDRRVLYVRPGAAGGDGTEAAPYGSFSDFAFGTLAIDTVIALSKGTHEGPVRLARGHVLRGACAEETVLRALEFSDTEAVVRFVGEGGEVWDLTIADSPRRGVLLDGAGIEGRLQGVVVTGTESVALFAQNGAHLSAQALVARDTASGARDGRLGRGLNVQSGATVDISRALFERNRDVGVHVSGTGTTLMLADAAVRGTEGRASDARFGIGLNIDLGATVGVVHALFESNRSSSVLVSDADSTVGLADVVVRDTRPRGSDDGFGRGLSVDRGATADVSRALFERNRDAGVFVGGAGGHLTLADAIVRDTESQASDDGFGRGLNVQGGASAEVTGGIFERNREVGLHAGGPDVALTLADVSVRDTGSHTIDGRLGRGVNVQSGATVEARRAVMTGNREVGLAAQSTATASLEDAVVSGTLPRGCVESTCVDAGAGHGVGSYVAGTMVRLTRFVIRDSALCGLHLAEDGQLDLVDGEVRGNTIGVCLQVDGYDSGRLTTRVLYTGNGDNLQATALPVPEPAAPVMASP